MVAQASKASKDLLIDMVFGGQLLDLEIGGISYLKYGPGWIKIMNLQCSTSLSINHF